MTEKDALFARNYMHLYISGVRFTLIVGEEKGSEQKEVIFIFRNIKNELNKKHPKTNEKIILF